MADERYCYRQEGVWRTSRKAYGGRAVLLPSSIASARDAPAAFGIGKRARSGVSLGPGVDIMEKSGTCFLGWESSRDPSVLQAVA